MSCINEETYTYKGCDFPRFHFWCYKVLPLVYDNSLSYYEVLCKVVKYINGMLEQCQTYGEELEKLWAEIKAIKEALENLDTETINNLIEQIKSVLDDIESMKTDIANLKVRVNALEIDNTTNQNNIADLQSRVTALEEALKDLTGLPGDLTDIKNIITEIQGDITNIKKIITEIQNDITNIKQTITEIQGDITNIKKTITDIQGDITNIQNTITDIQGDITNIQNTITDIQGDITNIDARVTNIENGGVGVVQNDVVYQPVRLVSGIVPDGSTDCSEAFSSLEYNIGLHAGYYQISKDCDITKQVVFAEGAILQIADDVTVTFHSGSEVLAGRYKIFSLNGENGTGKVVIHNQPVYPEWWGADVSTTEGTTYASNDYTTGIQYAVDSGHCSLGNREYVIHNTITMQNDAVLEGVSKSVTSILNASSSSWTIAIKKGDSNVTGCTIKNIHLGVAEGVTNTNNAIFSYGYGTISESPIGIIIDNVTCANNGGILFMGTAHSKITNCIFHECYHNIQLSCNRVSNSSIEISNCIINTNGTDAINIDTVTHTNIHDNYITQTGSGGLAINTSYSSAKSVNDITISNNVILTSLESSNSQGIAIQSGSTYYTNALITNNKISWSFDEIYLSGLVDSVISGNTMRVTDDTTTSKYALNIGSANQRSYVNFVNNIVFNFNFLWASNSNAIILISKNNIFELSKALDSSQTMFFIGGNSRSYYNFADTLRTGNYTIGTSDSVPLYSLGTTNSSVRFDMNGYPNTLTRPVLGSDYDTAGSYLNNTLIVTGLMR